MSAPRPELDRERASAALLDAIAVMDLLRSPGGCPWDAEQTHASLARYAIEEAHEVAEAAEAGSSAALADELGDLLLQVLFQARIAQEAPAGESFDIADVAAGLAAKLRRRHPHVFGDVAADDAEAVRAMWDDIKAAEKAAERERTGASPHATTSVLDGVPEQLPALMRAQKVLGRAQRAGIAVGPDFDVDPADEAANAAAEVGAELLAVVARAQALGVDAESALRSQVRGVARQVRDAEAERRGDAPG